MPWCSGPLVHSAKPWKAPWSLANLWLYLWTATSCVILLWEKRGVRSPQNIYLTVMVTGEIFKLSFVSFVMKCVFSQQSNVSSKTEVQVVSNFRCQRLCCMAVLHCRTQCLCWRPSWPETELRKKIRTVKRNRPKAHEEFQKKSKPLIFLLLCDILCNKKEGESSYSVSSMAINVQWTYFAFCHWWFFSSTIEVIRL